MLSAQETAKAVTTNGVLRKVRLCTAIASFLKSSGYGGGLAIEGNVKEDLLSDIRTTVEFLKPLLGVT